MRKEIDSMFRVAAIFLTASSAGCTRVTKPENPTQTLTPMVSPLPTLEEETHFITITPTPIATEENILIPTPELSFVRGNIDFGIPGELSLSMTKPFKYYSFGDIVVYPDEFGGETSEQTDLQKKWLDENFHPGDGTIVSEMDNLGNVILFIHDGYNIKDRSQLEAEAIRKYIEGFTEKTIDDPNHIKLTMQSLVDAKIEMTKDGITSDFIIKAIIQIPHDQVAYYDSTTEAIFENVYKISKNANKTEGATQIVEKYVKEGGGIAISICGWKVIEKDDKTTDIMTTWTRYIIFLEPVQTDLK